MNAVRRRLILQKNLAEHDALWKKVAPTPFFEDLSDVLFCHWICCRDQRCEPFDATPTFQGEALETELIDEVGKEG